MNIKEQLLSGRNKENIWNIANYIGSDPKRFADLWAMFFEEDPLPQYASWAFEKCGEKYPQLMNPYVEEMIEYMQGPVHDAVRRSFAKVLSNMDLPEEVTGDLYDLCIDWLLKEKTTIAVKAHCMSLAANIAMPYPELREELSVVLRDLMEHEGSIGVRSRGKRILKAMAKKG